MNTLEDEMIQSKNKQEQEIRTKYIHHYEYIKEEIDSQYRIPRGMKKLQTLQEAIDQQIGR
jgi:hypothetical protein